MTLLLVFVGIIALSNLLLLGAIAFLALAFKKFLDTSAASTLAEVKSTVRNVNSMVDKVEDRAEKIMIIGEDTARKVSGSVNATTEMVQNSLTTPLISVSSFVAGVTKAVETWRRASARV